MVRPPVPMAGPGPARIPTIREGHRTVVPQDVSGAAEGEAVGVGEGLGDDRGRLVRSLEGPTGDELERMQPGVRGRFDADRP